MIFPLDRLKLEHGKHYREGTLANFISWFNRTGFGDMLRNPYLNGGVAVERRLQPSSIDFSSLRGLCYRNISKDPANLIMQVHIERGVVNLQQLFANFVRCTAHTHLPGDFRKYCDFFSRSYTGSRYVLFDGSGTCLLLGAMFQSLAKNLLNEDVSLHYSHTSQRELTHVFGSWNRYFIDPDQKTWTSIQHINDAALFGYLFQQFGVAAYQVFLAMERGKREKLLSQMSRDYFEFYDGSRAQYMYQHEQSIQTLCDYFKQAREKHCSELNISSLDFPWKAEFLGKTREFGFEFPYFLVDLAREVTIQVPVGGSFQIGLCSDNLPIEAEQLASIFLGRVPGVLNLPMQSGLVNVSLPELPWMLVFENAVQQAKVNGQWRKPWQSGCGRYRVLGLGELEGLIDASDGNTAFELSIEAVAVQCALVLPINAFALASGLVDIKAEFFEVSGQVAQ